MHEYYFKIRKGDIEFECSTTDKKTFEEQLSDWINGIVKGSCVVPSNNEPTEIQNNTQNELSEQEKEEKVLQRSGFIDVKNLTSINEMQTPDFAANFNLGEKEEEQPLPSEISFEEALNDSIQNPKTEVVEKVDTISDFEEHIKSFNPQTQTDYLITTALYILNIENQERFSIKQINAKLVPLTGKPIDHAMIQQAIDEELIRIVPDLTGTSELTEYTLTEKGEGYFVE